MKKLKKLFPIIFWGAILGVFLFKINAFANYPYPGSSSPSYSSGSSGAAGGSQDFGAQVTQNTQKAMQIFSGVNAAAFLKTDDSDFVGFGGGETAETKLPVDVSRADLAAEQSDIDAQIEGDWNE